MDALWTNPQDILLTRLDCEFYQPEFVEHERRVQSVMQAGKLDVKMLGKIGKLKTGPFGSNLPGSLYRSSGVPLFRVQNIYPFFPKDDNMVFLEPSAHAALKASEVLPGSVLISKAGRVGDACVLPVAYGPSNITEHVIGMKVGPDTDPYYLVASLNEQFTNRQAKRFGLGTLLNYLGVDATRTVRVPIPSHEIQKAIGNKVRKAERLRELAQHESQSIGFCLNNLLGTPDVTHRNELAYWIESTKLRSYRINPKEYHPYSLRAEQELLVRFDAVPLRQALLSPNEISGGATPTGAEYVESGIGFLRVQNVLPNRLDLEDLVFIDAHTDTQLSRSRLKSLDVVLTITGFPGTACCVLEEDLPLNMNQHSVRFHLSDDWNPFFVAAFLNSPWGKAQVERRAIGGTRDALDYPSVLSLQIPQVDRGAQDEVASHAQAFAQCTRQSERLVDGAKAAVEALVNDTLDASALLAEGDEIERWLYANPSPFERN